MANRHLSRSIVLQALFEWDFSGKPEELKAIIDRDIAEFAPGHTDAAFMYELAETVQRKQAIIDDIIIKAAPEWPLEKISNVDRNILRMGLAELLFGDRDQVPPKVAINESIELAKNFGGENSGKFVNGVLGAVYKEIGEPGKEQLSKPRAPKEPEEPIDISKLVIEAKAGGIVHARHDGVDYIALVHDVFGYWTLPKGGVEEGESNEEGGKREMEEKLGITIDGLGPEIGAIDYVASHPEKGKIRKMVTFYLAYAKYQELDLHSNGGLDKAAWFQLHEVVDLTIYDDILPVIAKAIELITKK
ncbi:MAG TPA: transcription antitermination factor NusB [Candidatus Paceibacterota bacterium]|jgi:N utilization substance protein B|nr:transcription antitermination factor NusB [Candidatus Paceibacterota bacterium]